MLTRSNRHKWLILSYLRSAIAIYIYIHTVFDRIFRVGHSHIYIHCIRPHIFSVIPLPKLLHIHCIIYGSGQSYSFPLVNVRSRVAACVVSFLSPNIRTKPIENPNQTHLTIVLPPSSPNAHTVLFLRNSNQDRVG
jgi:hypothetical protein